MPGLLPDVDPDGLLEFSVVFTDRSLNHMSNRFQGVMNDISSTMRQVYNAAAVAVVPGGGTYGMEAVARQFATDQHCLVQPLATPPVGAGSGPRCGVGADNRAREGAPTCWLAHSRPHLRASA